METAEIPEQHQKKQPGVEAEMEPRPDSTLEGYRGSGKLQAKVAIITGGDSGIGRAAAVAFAKEGADIAIAYLEEHGDANDTKKEIEQCEEMSLIAGDVGNEHSVRSRRKDDRGFEHDILVNNAAEHMSGPVFGYR